MSFLQRVRITQGPPLVNPSGSSNPRSTLGESLQNLGRIIPWSVLQRLVKPMLYKEEKRTTTWVTRSLVRLKSNLRWFHIIHFCTSYITKVLLPTPSKTPFSSWWLILTTTSNGALYRQSQTHKIEHTVQNLSTKEKHMHWRKIKIVIIARPMRPKSNNKEKKKIKKETMA